MRYKLLDNYEFKKKISQVFITKEEIIKMYDEITKEKEGLKFTIGFWYALQKFEGGN